MFRKLTLAAALSASALVASIPSAASAQYYHPRGYSTVQFYVGPRYYYDRHRDWYARERWEHRRWEEQRRWEWEHDHGWRHGYRY